MSQGCGSCLLSSLASPWWPLVAQCSKQNCALGYGKEPWEVLQQDNISQASGLSGGFLRPARASLGKKRSWRAGPKVEGFGLRLLHRTNTLQVRAEEMEGEGSQDCDKTGL